MSNFYKMDPAAWDFGTAELTLEQEAAYLRIVNAIHKHDGPVPYVDRVIAGLFRCSTRKAKRLVAELIEAGKITVEDGHIWNERARSELVHRQLASSSAAVRGSKGGRTRANNAAKSLERNDQPQATASTRIEENRIESSSSARAREAEPDVAPKPDADPKSWTDDQLYDEVLSAVGLKDGRLPTYWMPPAAVVHVGRWRKDLGLSASQIVEVAHQCRKRHDEPPKGPKALDGAMKRMTEAMKAEPMQRGSGQSGGKARSYSQPDDLSAKMERWRKIAAKYDETGTG